ncbi:MAG: DUF2269 family protein [Candidatus Velamenicoccus archaeovorus]
MLAAILDYRWIVFIHIVGVLGFVMFHGVSVMVALRLRRERDRAKIAELMQFSGSSLSGMYASLLLLLVGGIWAGFELDWWKFAWIWVALGVLVLMIAEMSAVARSFYQRVKEAVEIRPSGVPRRSDEELDQMLRSPLPMVNAVLGFAALLFITWLMVYKPW